MEILPESALDERYPLHFELPASIYAGERNGCFGLVRTVNASQYLDEVAILAVYGQAIYPQQANTSYYPTRWDASHLANLTIATVDGKSTLNYTVIDLPHVNTWNFTIEGFWPGGKLNFTFWQKSDLSYILTRVVEIIPQLCVVRGTISVVNGDSNDIFYDTEHYYTDADNAHVPPRLGHRVLPVRSVLRREMAIRLQRAA